MAAVDPVSAGTAGYVDKVRGVYTGARSGSGEAILSVGTIDNNRTRFRQLIYYFASIGDGDTWTSGLPNIKACFWSGDTDNADPCNPALTSAATGVITFETGGATSNGFLLVMLDNDDTAHGFSQR